MNSYKIADLAIGHTEYFHVTITELMMSKFLEISGDTNPLHSDKIFAKQYGYHDKVVFGMLISSFYSKLVGVYLPGKYALLTNINIEFLKTVFVNDQLKITGEIIDIDNRFNFINIKSYITREETKVSKAKIRVGFNE
tara:strand:+ start:369 stop:782 length:414 start_codon:yes stop_codon:yes gene_type:complete